jgi:hypothetical protein
MKLLFITLTSFLLISKVYSSKSFNWYYLKQKVELLWNPDLNLFYSILKIVLALIILFGSFGALIVVTYKVWVL